MKMHGRQLRTGHVDHVNIPGRVDVNCECEKLTEEWAA